MHFYIPNPPLFDREYAVYDLVSYIEKQYRFHEGTFMWRENLKYAYKLLAELIEKGLDK